MYKQIACYCKRDPTCAYSAQNHDSGDCPRARDRTVGRCAVYVRNKEPKDNYVAFDRSCPFRAAALEEACNYRVNGPQDHQTAYRLTPEDSDPGQQARTPQVDTPNGGTRMIAPHHEKADIPMITEDLKVRLTPCEEGNNQKVKVSSEA
ncbi:hypothetical protein BJX99DRAFT_259175 [Aspergillus californicus]